MRYLDRYTQTAAGTLEKELERVAKFDGKAKALYENTSLRFLLKKIKNGVTLPPSSEFEGFAQYFFTDAKYGNHWASDLYYTKGETKLFEAVSRVANLMDLRNDIDFAAHCNLLGYTFPDGWPNNPELYAETVRQVEQEDIKQARIKAEQARLSFKLKQLWHRLLKRA